MSSPIGKSFEKKTFLYKVCVDHIPWCLGTKLFYGSNICSASSSAADLIFISSKYSHGKSQLPKSVTESLMFFSSVFSQLKISKLFQNGQITMLGATVRNNIRMCCNSLGDSS